eukprot:6199744-Pleurochrysis_carterae.AAC.2
MAFALARDFQVVDGVGVEMIRTSFVSNRHYLHASSKFAEFGSQSLEWVHAPARAVLASDHARQRTKLARARKLYGTEPEIRSAISEITEYSLKDNNKYICHLQPLAYSRQKQHERIILYNHRTYAPMCNEWAATYTKIYMELLFAHPHHFKGLGGIMQYALRRPYDNIARI